MASTIRFTASSGNNPESIFQRIKADFAVTEEDLQAAMEFVKDDILERTASGVDAFGFAFEPYSSKGPFYYAPDQGGRTDRSQKMLVKKIHLAFQKKGKKYDGELSKSGRSIKFSSYAAFKAASGSSHVDLRGLHIPGMLDEMEITVDAASNSARLSIAGEAAERANAHNFGLGRMPQRTFMSFSSPTKAEVRRIIAARIAARLRESR